MSDLGEAYRAWLSKREREIVRQAVELIYDQVHDKGWIRWKRRFARGLGYMIMINGLNDYLGNTAWYVGIPAWCVVAAIVEWGFCGRLRDWSGDEVRLPHRWAAQ